MKSLKKLFVCLVLLSAMTPFVKADCNDVKVVQGPHGVCVSGDFESFGDGSCGTECGSCTVQLCDYTEE